VADAGAVVYKHTFLYLAPFIEKSTFKSIAAWFMIQDYLTPLPAKVLPNKNTLSANQWGKIVTAYTAGSKLPTNFKGIKMAIVGVQEDRNGNSFCHLAPDAIRKELYTFYNWETNFKLADLGNITAGNTQKDTYFALSKVVAHLLAQGVIPIILGGTHDITYAQMQGHAEVEQQTSVVVFDEKIDLFTHPSTPDNLLSADTFLYPLLTQQPNLSGFTQIGYQRYLTDPEMVNTLEKLHFECFTLGEIRDHIEDVEPLVRHAQLVSIDMSCIKLTDAPAALALSANGFWSEEACRIARYIGLSDHVTSIGFYQFDPTQHDTRQLTARLVASMIWFFAEGVMNRKHELPDESNKRDYLKYIVNFKDPDHEIAFYKSKKTGRWWMNVPTIKTTANKQTGVLTPCSYSDYETACNDIIPDRWMKAFLRLNN